MGNISKEEYEKSRENVKLLRQCLVSSHNKIMSMVRELAKENENYESYKALKEQNEEIIMRYEAQQELIGAKEKRENAKRDE